MGKEQRILEELIGSKPEELTGEAKKLFEAIMKIADERDELLEKNKEYERQLDLEYVEDNYIHKDKVERITGKKDKIIDEMAEYINKLDIDEDICTKNIINPELCNEQYSNCTECIKQYFENLAKESGEIDED